MCGDTWFWGIWPSDECRNIPTLELSPIYVALHMLDIKDTVVQVVMDNETIVAVVNKLYSKDAALRNLLRPIALLCLRSNLQIITRHIPGEDNIGQDLLSRERVQEFSTNFCHKTRQPTAIPSQLLR